MSAGVTVLMRKMATTLFSALHFPRMEEREAGRLQGRPQEEGEAGGGGFQVDHGLVLA